MNRADQRYPWCMTTNLEPLSAGRHHPADYRDEIEHAEVARILAD